MIGTTTEATTGSSTRFRGSDRGWPAQRCGARCWPQPRTGRLTRCAHGHSHGEAESGMHGHTRPAGQQKPSPPVTARPILSIHPNRLGPSGLDRAIADRHARRGDANSHSPKGRMCDSASVGQPKSEVKWRDNRGPGWTRLVPADWWRSWSSAACSARWAGLAAQLLGPTATVV